MWDWTGCETRSSPCGWMFVPESRQLDFHRQRWLFDILLSTSKACVTGWSAPSSHITLLYICIKQTSTGTHGEREWLIFWFRASRLAPETTSEKRKERRLGSARLLYRVFTSFRPWSVCDRCGVPGEQVRIGLCYVHSHFLHVRYRRANQTVASCGSGAVPRAFGKLKRSRVGAKLEVRSCQVVCPPPAPRASSILSLMAFLGYK